MENKSGEMNFFVACQNGSIKTAKDLLKRADPSSLLSTWEGRTCFHVAVIAGDPDLFRELAAMLPGEALIKTITMKDNIGDTALHLAVMKNRVYMVKQLVDLDANLCDCTNNGGETPLKLAASLGLKQAVELLITHTLNGLHYIVELNQVKLVQFLIQREVDLSRLINKPYQPSYGGDQHLEEGGLTKSTDTDQSIVQEGDRPLHIAARNKFEHMVNLLLKVPGVDKHALNSEGKTAFDIAREVTEYHESFGIIRKLGDFRGMPKQFMYCAPQVSHKKLMEARRVVRKSYEDRRGADQMVAVLLATMTFTAALTVPGGFQTDTKQKDELGSPVLISFVSFKLFLILDCLAFFLALFICILRQMIPEHVIGDTVVFMFIINSLFCCSVSFTAFGFMAAVYTILGRKMETFSLVVSGIIIAAAFFCPLLRFAVTRARFHRLCGVSNFGDDIVEKVWCRAERCGLMIVLRSNDDINSGLMKVLRSNDDINNGPTPEHEVSSSPFRTGSSLQV